MFENLKLWAKKIRQDAHALYFVARDPRVAWYVKLLALFVAGYAFSPIDLIPDFIPVVGYLDDLFIVPLGIMTVIRLVPPHIMAEHRAHAALEIQKPVSRIAAAVIILIWLISIALAIWCGYHLPKRETGAGDGI